MTVVSPSINCLRRHHGAREKEGAALLKGQGQRERFVALHGRPATSKLERPELLSWGPLFISTPVTGLPSKLSSLSCSPRNGPCPVRGVESESWRHIAVSSKQLLCPHRPTQSVRSRTGALNRRAHPSTPPGMLRFLLALLVCSASSLKTTRAGMVVKELT